MSSQVGAKKSLVFIVFVMFSLIFLGAIYGITNDIAVGAGQELSYPSWITISYVAGLSMIVLPCTLPLVFIIVPLSMGQGRKKGLYMALLFGAGLTLTISVFVSIIFSLTKSLKLYSSESVEISSLF